eukprot:TRINITY_DN10580_c0_g1_i11.p1 TRINITY_DN10580_c0_g1~~TRINITY_DN10580_c0_g1_i11.p1  ORF type:complete len:103 (-),score=9.76 TRINITY_DN10580_c0_g1_i11:34-342(-)
MPLINKSLQSQASKMKMKLHHIIIFFFLIFFPVHKIIVLFHSCWQRRDHSKQIKVLNHRIILAELDKQNIKKERHIEPPIQVPSHQIHFLVNVECVLGQRTK